MSARAAGEPLLQHAPKCRAQQSLHGLAAALTRPRRSTVRQRPAAAEFSKGIFGETGSKVVRHRVEEIRRRHRDPASRPIATLARGFDTMSRLQQGLSRLNSYSRQGNNASMASDIEHGRRPPRAAANKSFEDLKRHIHGKLVEKLDFTRVKDLQSDALRQGHPPGHRAPVRHRKPAAQPHGARAADRRDPRRDARLRPARSCCSRTRRSPTS